MPEVIINVTKRTSWEFDRERIIP